MLQGLCSMVVGACVDVRPCDMERSGRQLSPIQGQRATELGDEKARHRYLGHRDHQSTLRHRVLSTLVDGCFRIDDVVAPERFKPD